MESSSVAMLTAELEVISVLISIFAFCLITGVLFIAAIATHSDSTIYSNLLIGLFIALALQLLLLISILLFGFNC